MPRRFTVAKIPARIQNAYLHDILEAARLIRGYMAGVSYDEFWDNSEKRDAVAMRLSVVGESARRINAETEKALPTVPFKNLGGLRNRIAHDYGAVDFKIVWQVTQNDIEPVIASLEKFFAPR
jgi:uncharacterized protein with HEPN domain